MMLVLCANLRRKQLLEHRSIIRALARAALAVPNPAARRQVERLKEAIRKSGDLDEAAGFGKLLEAEVAPLRVV
jgi:hypothetical protein